MFDPTGKTVLREFSRGRPGIDGDLTASAHPLTGCIGLTFKARSDIAGLGGAEIAQLFLNAGDGFKSVFYGLVNQGYPDEASEASVDYGASAEDLLDAFDCDEKVYENVDVAAAAFDLASRNRHPAVKIRASDFPLTGVTLDTFEATGLPLGEALSQLATLAAESNVAVGSGLDADGFVFLRPNPHLLRLVYHDGMFSGLPATLPRGLATAFRYVYGNTPSVEPWAGGYKPTTLMYLTVPNQELFERYPSRVGRDIPQSAWVALPESNYESSGFTNPQNAVSINPATAATRTGTGTPYFRLKNDDPYVYGARLLYRLSDDAPPVKFRATPQHAGGVGPYYEVELPKSDDLKPVDIKLPPAAATSAQGAFNFFATFQISSPAGGTFELFQAFLLRLDTSKLDAFALQGLSVPTRSPQQLIPRRATPQGLRGYLTELAAEVEVPSTPYGDQRGLAAGYRFGWNWEAEQVETYIDLEQAATDPDADLIRTIQLSLDRDVNVRTLTAAARRPL